MAGELKLIGPSGQNCDANILNASGQRWNGSAFADFSVGDIVSYRVTIAEDGTTGLYRGDMPTTVPAGPSYDVILVLRSTGRAMGSQTIRDWRGVGSVAPITPLGSQTGSSLRDYIVNSGWLRDDMDEQLYEAMTDTVLEMEQLFDFDERKIEGTTTDTIVALGDYKIAMEADLGHLISVVIIDGAFSRPLIPASKALFDALYPNPTADNDRGFPERFCPFGGYILVGPAPDRVTYQYRMAYSQRLVSSIDELTNPVPFSAKYREVIKDGVLGRLFKNVKNWDAADRFNSDYATGVARAIAQEKKNRRHVMNMPYQDC
jgi:hypothetical protein